MNPILLNQKVMIHSTEELPLKKYDGHTGWIMRQRKAHPEFWNVLTKDGNDNVFHESHLTPLSIDVRQIGLTQDGTRHSRDVLDSMIEFVKKGGRFNYDHLVSFNPKKTLLIAVTRYEDGSLRVRDGFNRMLAICIGRGGEMYDDEYFVEDLTYKRMMTANLPMNYFTPFDPRVEVRISELAPFNKMVKDILLTDHDPVPFIMANKSLYTVPKQPYHDSIETFAKWYLEGRKNGS